MAEPCGEEGARGRLLIRSVKVDLPSVFEFDAPLSKSMFYRFAGLVIATLGCVRGIPDAEDADNAINVVLEAGGVVTSDDRVCVDYFRESTRYEIDVGCSGGALRITLAPLLELAPRGSVIKAKVCKRMFRRLGGDSIKFFKLYGSVVLDEERGEVRIEKRVEKPQLKVQGLTSSQHVSGALLAAAARSIMLEREVCVEGVLEVSWGHFYQTLYALSTAGFAYTFSRHGNVFKVCVWGGRRASLLTPGDWSLAGFVVAMLSSTGIPVRVNGLWRPWGGPGDHALLYYAHLLGIDHDMIERGRNVVDVVFHPGGLKGRRTLETDLRDTPDLAVTLSSLCVARSTACRLRGLSHLALKESVRLETVPYTLLRLGIESFGGADEILVGYDSVGRTDYSIECREDHRIAMLGATAAIALNKLPLVIINPECVGKSWRGFWKLVKRIAIIG